MNIIEKLKTPTGRIILSIIWGFGLAMLFQRVCKNRKCILFEGPHPADVDGKVFRFGGSCYRYNVRKASCAKGPDADKRNIEVGDKQVKPEDVEKPKE